MERSHLIPDFNNTDNYINPYGWKPGRAPNHLSNAMTRVLSALKSGATAPTITKQPALSTSILTPSIPNTGIFNPVTPPVAVSKPADMNSPLVLAPNIPGGMATSSPQPVRDMLKTIQEQMTPAPSKTPPPSDAKIGGTQSLTAGMTLPNMKIMIGLIVGVIALYFLAKKYNK